MSSVVKSFQLILKKISDLRGIQCLLYPVCSKHLTLMLTKAENWQQSCCYFLFWDLGRKQRCEKGPRHNTPFLFSSLSQIVWPRSGDKDHRVERKCLIKVESYLNKQQRHPSIFCFPVISFQIKKGLAEQMCCGKQTLCVANVAVRARALIT